MMRAIATCLTWLVWLSLSAQNIALQSALALHRDGDDSRALHLADSLWRTTHTTEAWGRVCDARYAHAYQEKIQWYAAPIYTEMAHFDAPAIACALSPSRDWVAAGDVTGKVVLVNVRNHESYPLRSGGTGVKRLRFTQDGRYVLGEFRTGTFQLWGAMPGAAFGQEIPLSEIGDDVTLRADSIKPSLPPPLARLADNIATVVYATDSTQCLTAGYDGRVLLWQLRRLPVRSFAPSFADVYASSVGAGGQIATASGNIAYLRDSVGKILATFPGHELAIGSLAIFTQEKGEIRVVSAAGDKTVRLWTQPGNQLRVYKDTAGVFDYLSQVAVTPDGRYIAAGTGYNGSNYLASDIIVWNGLTGTKLTECSGHEGSIRRVSFVEMATKGSKTKAWHILSTSDDGTARLWDLQGHEYLRLEGHTGPVRAALYIPSFPNHTAAHFLTTDDNAAFLWTADGKRLMRLEEPFIKGAALHPTMPILATASDTDVSCWDLDGNRLFSLPVIFASQVMFSPDGEWLYTRSYDGLFCWRVAP